MAQKMRDSQLEKRTNRLKLPLRERKYCCRRPNIDPLLGVMPLQY
jgi:hypothetical protein